VQADRRRGCDELPAPRRLRPYLGASCAAPAAHHSPAAFVYLAQHGKF